MSSSAKALIGLEYQYPDKEEEHHVRIIQQVARRKQATMEIAERRKRKRGQLKVVLQAESKVDQVGALQRLARQRRATQEVEERRCRKRPVAASHTEPEPTTVTSTIVKEESAPRQSTTRTKQEEERLRQDQEDGVILCQAMFRNRVAHKALANRRDVRSCGFHLRRVLDHTVNSAFKCRYLSLLVDTLERPRKRALAVLCVQKQAKRTGACHDVACKRENLETKKRSTLILQRASRRFLAGIQVVVARTLKEAKVKVTAAESEAQERAISATTFLPQVQASLRSILAFKRVIRKIASKVRDFEIQQANDPFPLIIDDDLLSGKKPIGVLKKKAHKKLFIGLSASGGGGNSPIQSSTSPHKVGSDTPPRNAQEEPSWLLEPTAFSPQGIRILRKEGSSTDPFRKILSGHDAEVHVSVEHHQRNLLAQKKWRRDAKTLISEKKVVMQGKVEAEATRRDKLKELQDIKTGKIPCPSSPYRGREKSVLEPEEKGRRVTLPPIENKETRNTSSTLQRARPTPLEVSELKRKNTKPRGLGGIPEKDRPPPTAFSPSIQVHISGVHKDKDAQKKAVAFASAHTAPTEHSAKKPEESRMSPTENLLPTLDRPQGKLTSLAGEHLPASQSSLRKVVIVPVLEDRPRAVSEASGSYSLHPKPILKKASSVLLTDDSLASVVPENTRHQYHSPASEARTSDHAKRPFEGAVDVAEKMRREKILKELSRMQLEELEALAHRTTGFKPPADMQNSKTPPIGGSTGLLRSQQAPRGQSAIQPLMRCKDIRNQKRVEAQQSLKTTQQLGARKQNGGEKGPEEERTRQARKSWKSAPPDWATTSGDIPRK